MCYVAQKPEVRQSARRMEMENTMKDTSVENISQSSPGDELEDTLKADGNEKHNCSDRSN